VSQNAFTLIELVVLLVIMALLISILIPVLAVVRRRAWKTKCGRNLSQISKVMHFYVNDYRDQLPRAGGPNSTWGDTADWQADNLSDAFGLKDGDGEASICASLYLLVKYEQVTPNSFICRGDTNTTEFIPAKYGVREKDLIDLWDFGADPAKHCSYSYHIPYGLYALTSSNLPGMAVVADRNPWIDSPSANAKGFAAFDPNGSVQQIRTGNAIAHQEDGQNVLYVDGHVSFEKRAFCAVDGDNIYTFWDGGDIRRGGAPVVGITVPMDRKDSFLVHDPPVPGVK
jgi:prepilin-type processing-associated H-X9-DG protein